MCLQDGGDQGVSIDAPGGSGGVEPLTVVAQAIDQLAAQDLGLMTYAEIAGRVARIWALLGSIDPELARLAAKYTAGPPKPGPASSAFASHAASDADDLDV